MQRATGSSLRVFAHGKARAFSSLNAAQKSKSLEAYFQHAKQPNRQDPIQYTQSVCVHHLKFNRHQTMNVMKRDALALLSRYYKGFENNELVKAVCLQGQARECFCSGIDFEAFYNAGPPKPNEKSSQLLFLREFYNMLLSVHDMLPVQLSILDGTVVGSGLSIPAVGSFRVVTDNTVICMPQTGFGYFPDGGCSEFLSRLSGEMGAFIALTGAHLSGRDAMFGGIGTHFVDSESVVTMCNRLNEAMCDPHSDGQVVTQGVLAEFSERVNFNNLEQHAETIAKCFAHDSVDAIVAALREENTEWATSQAAAISRRCPSSAAATLMLIRLLRTARVEEEALCKQKAGEMQRSVAAEEEKHKLSGRESTSLSQGAKQRLHETAVTEGAEAKKRARKLLTQAWAAEFRLARRLLERDEFFRGLEGMRDGEPSATWDAPVAPEQIQSWLSDLSGTGEEDLWA
mmetsp:Transcript_17681/g.41603  ORF Transcript_17681/g.41603 Transcript_17681/m.41603 type:complete len:458 (-) Transcript_17681:77-1450(-)